ncbi:MAG: phosphoenolpyruvate--protein phosphotransferase [Bacteroidales bacterium]|nr:phosphoenolpyruvate--protein phosphotransferase [Bacteroidales bacterium]MCM1416109.1 phosphoenolpyruvate--protein phosphotransferase [bacterium]MCM1422841.1 phosphoenolpyruvate--protein phosphotransferase [bacterium]
MERFHGKSVMQGIAVGRLCFHRRTDYHAAAQKASDPEAERARFFEALEAAKAELAQLYEEALADVGEEQAQIFEIHRMLLEDETYLGAVSSFLAEGYQAAYAVDSAGKDVAAMFTGMEDAYMRSRAADIMDISQRVLRALLQLPEERIRSDEPAILAADDLTPSETLKLDKKKILAFVTVKGSVNSHTAILARSMGIPALVNTAFPLSEALEGKLCVVDGFAGELILEPDEALLDRMLAKREVWEADNLALEQLKGQENVTRSGKKIQIFANIGNVEDAEAALLADAGGVGLFRSEFLYLGRESAPTEEEQFAAYRTVLQKMAGKKVVIRTLDIGADKRAGYFGLDEEENPALGYRGIRICLDREDIFTTQLRALYRASIYGKLAIMFPMIVSAGEVLRIRRIAERVRTALLAEGCALGEVELGIMIETPAAALISDLLARQVDFFSIGTNDLTQYTLAADRENRRLEKICDARHEAVLRLIEMTVKNAHTAGIWVGICGELASDETLTARFLELGVDELSVPPAAVLRMRRTVRRLP